MASRQRSHWLIGSPKFFHLCATYLPEICVNLVFKHIHAASSLQKFNKATLRCIRICFDVEYVCICFDVEYVCICFDVEYVCICLDVEYVCICFDVEYVCICFDVEYVCICFDVEYVCIYVLT